MGCVFSRRGGLSALESTGGRGARRVGLGGRMFGRGLGWVGWMVSMLGCISMGPGLLY